MNVPNLMRRSTPKDQKSTHSSGANEKKKKNPKFKIQMITQEYKDRNINSVNASNPNSTQLRT